MKKLGLIASDFDTLDEDCSTAGTGQYTVSVDCPIARAAKRQWPERVGARVNPEEINWAAPRGTKPVKIAGGLGEVERCREELLAGAEIAYIDILKETNYGF